MDRINEIRERASKATKGVWVVELYKADGWEGHYGVKSQSGVTIVPAHCSWDGFGHGASKNNADFIAHSKSDIEYLLSEIDRLKAEQKHLLKIASKMHLWIFLNTYDEQKTYEEIGLTEEDDIMLGYAGEIVIEPKPEESKDDDK